MASDKYMSPTGLATLMQLEGCKNEVYLDAGGKETIGVGHLLTDEEKETGLIHGHSYGDGLTYDQCLDVLSKDVAWAEAAVNTFVYVPLNQNQFDALVSFCFNVGRHAFKTSTLVKTLNRHQYGEVPAQLRRWNKVNGKTNHGLVARRAIEVDWWRLPEYVTEDTVAPDDIPLSGSAEVLS